MMGGRWWEEDDDRKIIERKMIERKMMRGRWWEEDYERKMLRRRRRRRRGRRKTDPKTGKHTLRKPAQSKCTWTCHKRHFVQKFSGKMPNAPDTTSVEHRALTLTVRTPLCGHTVWGTTIGKENKKDRNAYEIKRKWFWLDRFIKY